MKIIADTNILLRAALNDSPAESRAASVRLAAADLIAVPVPVLCEFVWVLARGYDRSSAEIAGALRRLVGDGRVVTDSQAVSSGLAVLEAGGDFADGAIVAQGRMLGGEVFLTFDRKAAAILAKAGIRVELPASV